MLKLPTTHSTLVTRCIFETPSANEDIGEEALHKKIETSGFRETPP